MKSASKLNQCDEENSDARSILAITGRTPKGLKHDIDRLYDFLTDPGFANNMESVFQLILLVDRIRFVLHSRLKSRVEKIDLLQKAQTQKSGDAVVE